MRRRPIGNSAEQVPVIGQGCLGLGDASASNAALEEDEVRGLRRGVDLGMTFLDTAEVYGGGRSEEIVGKAVRGIRSSVFIATKVAPENLSHEAVLRAAHDSLRRLRTDYIDLYQIHWPNPSIPVDETMRAMARLKREGKIRFVGVSNFSVREMIAAQGALGGEVIASNQVEYSLFDRFIENHVLPYSRERGVTVIAYGPLNGGRLLSHPMLSELGRRYETTPAQVALNWLVRQGVVAIPATSSADHQRENATAADFVMSDMDAELLSSAFATNPLLIPIGEISAAAHGGGKNKVYETLEQALKNDLNFAPSPEQLARDFLNGDPIKPVRLVRASEADCKYHLVEGRIRYWAWVIAHRGTRPIPALIRT